LSAVQISHHQVDVGLSAVQISHHQVYVGYTKGYERTERPLFMAFAL
jgi:hypothetical protein